ncbi:MAG: hypothetical protein ACRDYC_06485, partial [Acidimicrobiales bacterium]
ERNRLAAALQRLTGEQLPFPTLRDAASLVAASPSGSAGASGPGSGSGSGSASASGEAAGSDEEALEPAAPLVQASWADGRLVVWAGAPNAAQVTGEGLEKLLAEADAAGIDWERHSPVPVPGGHRAEARSAPIAKAFGWLVGVGSGSVGGPVGPSVRWMGEVAVWGTQLVAEGRMIPLLRGAPGGSSSSSSSSGGGQAGGGQASGGQAGAAVAGGAVAGSTRHRVRWVPALLERERLADLVARMPGSVVALQSSPQPDGVCRSVLSAVVDSITRYGAGKVNLPAALAAVTSRVEISEAVLAGLDGHSFNAPTEVATRVAEDLKRWSAPVTLVSRVGLVVRLDPPSADGGWLLSVVATGVDRQPLPVENALVVASGHKAQQVEAQLRRLERLLPVLRRPTTRRGQVILDSEEAADLMFNIGPVIAGTGFEVMLPAT